MPSITEQDISKLLDVRDDSIGRTIEGLDSNITGLTKGVSQTRIDLEKQTSRLSAVEAKLNRHGGMTTTVDNEPRPFSEILLVNKAFNERPREWQRGARVNIDLVTKDILGIGTHRPATLPYIAPGARQTLGVRNLIPSSSVSGTGAVVFDREASFTNAAAMVAEGAAKPQSAKTFTAVTLPFETVAHWIRCSKQCYQDAAGLAALIDSNLIYGLLLTLENQLLKGSNTSPQLHGLYTNATAAAAPTGTPTMLDTLLLGVAELAGKGYNPTGIVVSNVDYVSMQMSKDSTGRYLMSDIPSLPTIVTSPFLAAGEWLVGDFSQTHLFVREEANVQISESEADNFTKNLLTLLGEMRVALAILQPGALLKNPAGATRDKAVK